MQLQYGRLPMDGMSNGRPFTYASIETNQIAPIVVGLLGEPGKYFTKKGEIVIARLNGLGKYCGFDGTIRHNQQLTRLRTCLLAPQIDSNCAEEPKAGRQHHIHPYECFQKSMTHFSPVALLGPIFVTQERASAPGLLHSFTVLSLFPARLWFHHATIEASHPTHRQRDNHFTGVEVLCTQSLSMRRKLLPTSLRYSVYIKRTKTTNDLGLLTFEPISCFYTNVQGPRKIWAIGPTPDFRNGPHQDRKHLAGPDGWLSSFLTLIDHYSEYFTQLLSTLQCPVPEKRLVDKEYKSFIVQKTQCKISSHLSWVEQMDGIMKFGTRNSIRFSRSVRIFQRIRVI
ncbi:hypothetical protein CSKR_106919 [Clonorchis sinensis]|uniref:Uncharacterized protein n=1 Tax=Clonorchis sinensis TaxID=79923 RepID=A0A3R7D3N3_CLOSI|nr:hypothetical protein CSKR_106919 [Clonorchis sinensis]